MFLFGINTASFTQKQNKCVGRGNLAAVQYSGTTRLAGRASRRRSHERLPRHAPYTQHARVRCGTTYVTPARRTCGGGGGGGPTGAGTTRSPRRPQRALRTGAPALECGRRPVCVTVLISTAFALRRQSHCFAYFTLKDLLATSNYRMLGNRTIRIILMKIVHPRGASVECRTWSAPRS